jgi:hypothetical protein
VSEEEEMDHQDLQEDSKYGVWALSGGWNVANEDFMSNVNFYFLN